MDAATEETQPNFLTEDEVRAAELDPHRVRQQVAAGLLGVRSIGTWDRHQ